MAFKPIYTTLILCYCFYGCDYSAKKEENVDDKGIYSENVPQNYEREKPAPYFFESRTFTRVEADCADNCAEVQVTYPLFDKEEAINQQVSSHITTSIADFILTDDEGQDFKALSDLFIMGYQDFKTEFPDVSTPWSISVLIEVGHQHPAFVSFFTTTTSYTGGAHPMQIREYWNLSGEGKNIDQMDFFIADFRKLHEVAETIFRSQKKIPANQKLSEAGYSFENDQFELSDNYGFNESGMVFYYNSYEIGPYVMGPTELVIPYDKLQGLYKFQPQS